MEVCRLEVLLQYMQPDINKLILYYYIIYSSSAFFTENRITVFTKDIQLYLISFYLTFIIEIHCLNIE
mgnify:CR=1 FL=1